MTVVRGGNRRKWIIGGLVGLTGVSGLWLAWRTTTAMDAAAAMQADAQALRTAIHSGNLGTTATALTALRRDADRARSATGDPLFVVAGYVPFLGRDAHAATAVSRTVADIADAAQPLEQALPQLDRGLRSGTIDMAAVTTVSQAMPQLAAMVAQGDTRMAGVDPAPLTGQVSQGVRSVQESLAAARGPVADAVPTLALLPSMLGSKSPRTWVVLLQQGAEARGTGGLVGAYAVLRTDQGRLSLVKAAPRGQLQEAAGKIPTEGMPEDLQDLWGKDLAEWAGLNLSPNFPWTGRLVAQGWASGGLSPKLDYVAGLDQGVVSALLAATGPVTVRDNTLTASNVVPFLTKGVYSKYADYNEVDQVTAELVREVFTRFSSGRVNLGGLVRAMVYPVEQRRLQLWSADEGEQKMLETMPVAGLIPDQRGPFAMAVVNNGGGNKLDAYLKVNTSYDPGRCSQQVRVGKISVSLQNTAPSRGLPDYVDVRSDVKTVGLKTLGLTSAPRPGSNRILLDVYGPVDSQAALMTVNGEPVVPVVGTDRGHTVWRVAVPLDPGESKTVDVALSQPVGVGPDGGKPVVMTQPMVNPVGVKVTPVTPCENRPKDQG